MFLIVCHKDNEVLRNWWVSVRLAYACRLTRRCARKYYSARNVYCRSTDPLVYHLSNLKQNAIVTRFCMQVSAESIQYRYQHVRNYDTTLQTQNMDCCPRAVLERQRKIEGTSNGSWDWRSCAIFSYASNLHQPQVVVAFLAAESGVLQSVVNVTLLTTSSAEDVSSRPPAARKPLLSCDRCSNLIFY